MKSIVVFLAIFATFDGFSKKPLDSKGIITVRQAVELLDKNDKEWSAKVKGVFELTVRASGKDSKWGYLNSNLNYRTKYNLTIVLSKHIRKRLAKKYGQDPLEYFIGKTIRVKGEAKKIKIYKIVNKKRTNLVYFQSHVILESLRMIEVVE
ncbi:MAG: hypothetical protein L3J52_08990 [Proteobacteria bacterium]|nr:hypothetical protein [Pseudomonadota bacterium]